MITGITIRNFKKLEEISFSLAQSVVLIGPNNSGKSTIFQALCLWEIGVTNYLRAVQKNDLNPRGTVTINRRDLLNSPIADARSLWRDKKVTYKNVDRGTKHVVLSVELKGEDEGKAWAANAEFEFSNNESFSCRLTSGAKELSQLYNADKGIHFGFLQTMSGISTSEDKLTKGSIDRKLGEGKTAEVLRNICFEVLHPDTPPPIGYNIEEKWDKINKCLKELFGADLKKPEFIKSTGTIELQYVENGIHYDISSGGRGFQQTLLLLAYMYANPNTILLLDEPDAHLEVIRQREIFQLVNEIAIDTNAQLLIASHSEVVLDEAADASKVIALIEHAVIELNDASSPQKIKSIKKSLTEIGWEKYYLARIKKHVVYLEGSTDLQMLQLLAQKLKHKIDPFLTRANVQYTANNVPNTAVSNYAALKEIFGGLKGIALFDNLPNLVDNPKLKIMCWKRRELENYFAKPKVLIKFAKMLSNVHPNLNITELEKAMHQTIQDFTVPMYLKDLNNAWWNTAKISDDWLDIIFPEFYKRIGLVQHFYKRDYYQLINLLTPDEIDQEIVDKLDAIYEVIKG